MGMGKQLEMRSVPEEERQALERLARSRKASAQAVERAQVVLATVEGATVEGATVEGATVEGATVEEIAVHLDLARGTVYLWWHHFEERGLAGLEDHGGPAPAGPPPRPLRVSRWGRSSPPR